MLGQLNVQVGQTARLAENCRQKFVRRVQDQVEIQKGDVRGHVFEGHIMTTSQCERCIRETDALHDFGAKGKIESNFFPRSVQHVHDGALHPDGNIGQGLTGQCGVKFLHPRDFAQEEKRGPQVGGRVSGHVVETEQLHFVLRFVDPLTDEEVGEFREFHGFEESEDCHILQVQVFQIGETRKRVCKIGAGQTYISEVDGSDLLREQGWRESREFVEPTVCKLERVPREGEFPFG